MQLTNYYLVLKIEKSASENEIKKAFRREVQIYHPDKNKASDASEKFNNVVEAYEVLIDPERRTQFDLWLAQQEMNKPVLVETEAQQTYRDWQKESRKKSKTYADTSIGELLLFDIFLGTEILEGLADGAGELFDGATDILGDIFDLF